MLEACHSWRRSECKGGKCVCTNACVGIDEKCYTGSDAVYQYIGGEKQVYRLINARWPENRLYCDDSFLGIRGVGAGKDPNRGHEFTLLQPPSDNQGRKGHLLYSTTWPDSAITFDAVKVAKTGGTVGYSPTFKKVNDADLFGRVPSIIDLAIYLAQAPGQSPDANRSLVMIGSMKYPNQYLYMPEFSTTSVAVWKDDPGAGGYWYFEPPLPKEFQEQLPLFNGPHCTHACGQVRSASFAMPSRLPSLAILLVSAIAATWALS